MAGKALITGLSGFTGHYVAEELRALGYEVFGLATGDSPADHSVAVDLRDAEALNRLVAGIQPDVVVHLAAVAFVAHSDVSDMYGTNVVGTRNLLQALALCDKTPDKVLLASSANIYGNAAVPVIEETCAPQPANDYGVSKYAMEMMARCWQQQLPIVITRPFNYTGVGQPLAFLLPKIVDHFARRQAQIELGNIDVYRDFSDVRVVAKAYGGLLSAGQPGEVYNVCSGVAHSIEDVLGMLASAAGYAIDVQVNPAFVRANEIKRLTGSRRKLEAAIGPLDDIPLADTLQWMYQSQIQA